MRRRIRFGLIKKQKGVGIARLVQVYEQVESGDLEVAELVDQVLLAVRHLGAKRGSPYGRELSDLYEPLDLVEPLDGHLERTLCERDAPLRQIEICIL